ncbi:O-antigen ligase family protein [Polaribacter marinivivus]|uniref:O-antigen ligase family protein n=1 Tax=Polaribacter marinivivus TaxID=1524260 RepID=A0ABV8R725_9FLAO
MNIRIPFKIDISKNSFFAVIAFLLFGLIPLTSQKLEAVFVAIFIFLLIVQNFFNVNEEKKEVKFYTINTLLFLVLLFTFFDGFDYLAYKKLEQLVSLLIFPIIFYLLSNQKRNEVNKLFKIWQYTFLGSTLLLVFVVYYLVYNYSNPRYPNFDSNLFKAALSDSSFFSRDPAYISMFMNVAILICLDFLNKASKKINKVYLFLIIIFLLIPIFLFSSKIAILGLVTCSIIYIIISFKKERLPIIISLCLLFFTTIFLLPSKLNRFTDLFSNNILKRNVEYNSTFVHKETIKCSYDIFKSNFLFGVGLENTNTSVNNCVRKTFTYNEGVIYNPHNQYLGFALHSGILALLIFIYVIYNGLRLSYKNNKFLFLTVVYFCVFFFTENVLERQSGLVLFCFLFNTIPLIKSK